MIGGQHSVAALQLLRQERAKAGMAVDLPWLTTVRAEQVVRFGTPLSQLQLLAGDHQAAQSDVRELPMSDFLRLLVATDASQPLQDRIAMAIQKAGWARPERLV